VALYKREKFFGINIKSPFFKGGFRGILKDHVAKQSSYRASPPTADEIRNLDSCFFLDSGMTKIKKAEFIPALLVPSA
jgi:hypothetical protein